MGETSWHALASEEALRQLETSPTGLSTAEAERRRARYGPNRLEPPKGPGILRLLGKQLNTPIIYLLMVSGAVALAVGKPTDATVVFAAVILNALIGLVQELRANQAILALGGMVPEHAVVLRDGERKTLSAAELVPGDVVELAPGDRVPADGRLLATYNLQIEEAALTGESVPASKAVEPVSAEAGVGDRLNMTFSGTTVASGAGKALVTATGTATELGRISRLLREAQVLETPLTQALTRVGRWLTLAVVLLAGVLFGVSLYRGYNVSDGLLAAVTLAVAAIPEGLPAVITIALAIGVQRMAGRRAIVRQLPSVETLGSTTVICTDKTGTLTRNEMTVQALFTPAGEYALTGTGYAPQGTLHRDGAPLDGLPDDAMALLRAGALCNDAALRQEDGRWLGSGDPTEVALLVSSRKAGLAPEELSRRWPRRDVVPFDSAAQRMATLHGDEAGGNRLLVKGAPEVVIASCGLAAAEEQRALEAARRFADRGMRVLAMAEVELPRERAKIAPGDLEGPLRFLGLQGLMDPPRPESVRAIDECHRAGIAVKMITGDHAGTAASIGRQVGLAGEGRVLTGAQIGKLDDAGLRTAVGHTNVFARVAPEHKLRLVRALQSDGHVVAMTGDGVNDSPSLKQADIGVAMGLAGTAAAREAADIVLADDNFATISAAVEEGRRIYDNLVKSIAFVLPTNLGLGLILVSAVFLFPIERIGTELVPLMPMLPTQLLWVNLVASVTLSAPLAFEVPEPNLMSRPPRRPGTPILSAFVLERTVLVAALLCLGAVGLFLWEYRSEVPRVGHAQALREAQTTAVTTVVFFQIFYLLNCRSLRESVLRIGFFSNPPVLYGAGLLLVLQAGFIYLPFMQKVFSTAPLDAGAIGRAALVGAVILPVVSLEKAIRAVVGRRRERGDAAEPAGAHARAWRPRRGET